MSPILAQSYLAQGKYKELVRDFRPQGLAADQVTPLLINRALAQLALGDQAAAIASAADAERLSPQSVEAALASARIQLGRRDFQASEAKVDRALQINPRNIDAMLFKGQLQNVKGDRTRAIEAFVATPQTRVRIARAGVYRINVSASGVTEVAVQKGRAFVGEGAETQVKGGQLARVGAGGAEGAKLDKKSRDTLDQWSHERAKELRRELRSILEILNKPNGSE